MNNNDLSLINLSEIRFLTGDTGERENADAMMQERGLLTDKGNPSVSGIAEQNEHYTTLLLNRLSYKLQFRENGFECIRNTYLKMYSEKDYTGMFLLTVLMYGLIGWRTPLNLNLMSSRKEMLKIFFGEFVRTLEDFKPKRSARYGEKEE